MMHVLDGVDDDGLGLAFVIVEICGPAFCSSASPILAKICMAHAAVVSQ